MNDYDKVIADLDDDFLKDFADSAGFECTRLECKLMFLYQAADKSSRLAEIIDILERLRTHVSQIFIDPMSGYLEALCQLVQGMSDGSVAITEELNELVLLIVDDFIAAVEELASWQVIDADTMLKKQQCIAALCRLGPAKIKVATIEMIPLFLTRVDREMVASLQREYMKQDDMKRGLKQSNSPESHDELREHNAEGVEGEKVVDTKAREMPVVEAAVSDAPSNTEKDFAIIEVKIPQSSQLAPFENLANFFEDRCELWQGRAKTVMRICLQINIQMGIPVDELQLCAAVYMHDIAMAFLPDEVLFKKDKYDSYEVMLLQQHTTLGYDMMSLMGDWQPAADMVHHHHEKFDGSGYPQGLRYGEICLGAKIIAVADTYYSFTNGRPDRDFRRSGLRALSEINRCNGTQFDPHVVAAFNHVMRLDAVRC